MLNNPILPNASGASHGDNQSPPANVATSTSHGDQRTPTIEELQAQLADLQHKNAEFLSDNAKYRKKQKEQEEAAQAAEQQRLKEQGEFKQLAEQHAARVQELEPVAEHFTQLSALVAEQIKAQIKDWPAEVKTFDPGPDAPIEQRLAWLEKSKPLIDKLAQQARTSNPGNMPNPRPAPPGTRDDAIAQFEKRLRQSGKYGA